MDQWSHSPVILATVFMAVPLLSVCLHGEWTPSPETVMCVAMNTPIPSEDKVNTVLNCHTRSNGVK